MHAAKVWDLSIVPRAIFCRAPFENTFDGFGSLGAPPVHISHFARRSTLTLTPLPFRYDKEVVIDASSLAPTLTWGTSPEDAVPITACVPDPAQAPNAQVNPYIQVKRGTKAVYPTAIGIRPIGNPGGREEWAVGRLSVVCEHRLVKLRR
jgi:hypothetical protein